MSEQFKQKHIKTTNLSDNSSKKDSSYGTCKNHSLSRTTREKVYEYIKENRLVPDDALPTEATFMEMLGVSRSTIREALALLEQEKLIYRIQGKGTFLNKRPLQIESGLEKLESITETIKGFGLTPGTRWVGIEIKSPTNLMIEKLKINNSEKVITFKRVRTANENLASYCVDTVPLKYFDTIPHEINEESLLFYLKKNLGILIESAVTDIIPTLPTEEMIRELDVSGNQLFLLLQQVHFDNKGIPVIFSKDYFKSDIFKFKINRIR